MAIGTCIDRIFIKINQEKIEVEIEIYKCFCKVFFEYNFKKTTKSKNESYVYPSGNTFSKSAAVKNRRIIWRICLYIKYKNSCKIKNK